MTTSTTKATKQTTPKRLITNTHKAALAKGREESHTVGRYLEELDATRPKRGRKRTPATINKRLSVIDQKMATADALSRLNLIQEKKDLLEELSHNNKTNEFSDLESQFIKVGKSYAERKGISYSTWRAVGVPASVLEKAGITRKGDRPKGDRPKGDRPKGDRPRTSHNASGANLVDSTDGATGSARGNARGNARGRVHPKK